MSYNKVLLSRGTSLNSGFYQWKVRFQAIFHEQAMLLVVGPSKTFWNHCGPR